ncbi:Dehydrogenases with different specificities (related to short-chain alcohol dehydrogenases) [Ceraceosorus bombacis]|uniref:Dehydrogenases with different specificities (Related to short-chain alcohol dehydrogenases) n=1 Tax=Ceraceosorus bombacis TaxID=401625 RepID=A0A0P1BHZ9_9BASI|nr:Dehydrogenases with different specificities (related to short-chain alcohol dehydrogenases) [Ceraceosorus bombacis]
MLMDLIRGSGIFAGKSPYNAADVPDQTGRVHLVTGANTGIGFVTAKALAAKHAKVYLACRNTEKGQEAIEKIKKAQADANVVLLKLDLGSLAAVKAAAEEFLSKETRLDVLINSAGVMTPPKGSKTLDGYELTFGTNNIGHHAFTQTLLPLIKKTAASSPPNSVRIVYVSSAAHWNMAPKKLDFEAVKEPNITRLAPGPLYGQSKLVNIQQAKVLARQLKDDGVIVTSLHPGIIASDLYRYMGPFLTIFMSSVELGAVTQLYCATSPNVTLADSGEYYVPWARKFKTQHALADNVEEQQKAWDYLEKQVGDFYSKHAAEPSTSAAPAQPAV